MKKITTKDILKFLQGKSKQQKKRTTRRFKVSSKKGGKTRRNK